MSTAIAPLVMFGDLDGDLWGIVLGGERPRAAVARLNDAGIELRPADLDRSDDEIWELTSAGCELRIERADAMTSSEGGASLEPCRVSGSATLDGSRREFDIGGVRASSLEAAGDSLRLFAAWFPAGHEIAAAAVRPRGAKGHDRDRLEAVARGEEHPLVIDPRLSTTYDGDGVPLRVGLELWLGDDADGELWPRRVAGSATGSSISAGSGSATGGSGSAAGGSGSPAGAGLTAYAFDCVSRGEPGAGVYVLLSP